MFTKKKKMWRVNEWNTKINQTKIRLNCSKVKTDDFIFLFPMLSRDVGDHETLSHTYSLYNTFFFFYIVCELPLFFFFFFLERLLLLSVCFPVVFEFSVALLLDWLKNGNTQA